MTDLRVVDPSDIHSVKADLISAEQIADVQEIVRTVMGPVTVGLSELSIAVRDHDKDGLISAMRRIVAVSYAAKENADKLDRDPVWQTPS